jgi:quinol monooxygenase YgiN
MSLYQIKIIVKKYKMDEFVDFLRSLSSGFRKEKGCVNCCAYKDLDDEHACCIVAEWETPEIMQQHFLTQKFEVLIGAAKVLGEKFEMIVAEVMESEGIELPAKNAAHNYSPLLRLFKK